MNLSPLPIQKFFDNAGNPLNGGLLFTYVAGTTTKIATYQDQAGTPNTNPIVLNFRGEANVWLDQTLTYKFVLAPSADTDPPTNPIWSVDNISAGVTFASLTQQIIGQLLYPKDGAENAAGVTIINFNYPYGYWDRYGTNTTPGTTDMAPAANAAYQVAKQTGCSVRLGATAPYRAASPINCTQMRGVVTWDESSKNLSAGAPSVIIDHDGQTYSHGFDLSASTEMVFNNLCVANGAGKVPNSVFFMARNAAGSGAGLHRFNNCRTDASARFKTIIYNFGSEENDYNDFVFYQNQPGSTILNHNASNPSGYTSNFVTIAASSPAQSNVVHRYRGCSLFQLGNSGSVNESCIQLEHTGNFSFEEGLFYNPFGLCYVNMVGTAPCNDFALTNVRGEQDGVHTCTYGVYVQTTGTTGVNTHANWTLRGNTAICSGEFLRFVDTAEILNLDMGVNAASSGLALNVYNMTYSRIFHGTSVVTGRAGGTVSNNTFIGVKTQITLNGTNTANGGFNQATGQTWETGDSVTGASAACTGAITVSAGWSLTRRGGTVLLALPAVVQTSPTAAASFTFATVIPTGYRPAANLRFPCVIQDNSAVLNQLGFVFINASTGAISVFKDVVGTANWTAAGTGGLPAPVSLPWSV